MCQSSFLPVNECGAQLEFQNESLQLQQDLPANLSVFVAIVGLVHARRIYRLAIHVAGLLWRYEVNSKVLDGPGAMVVEVEAAVEC